MIEKEKKPNKDRNKKEKWVWGDEKLPKTRVDNSEQDIDDGKSFKSPLEVLKVDEELIIKQLEDYFSKEK